ncbi:MAG: hypothetical protein LBS23_03385 [Holosporaceae bacterium]|nr:hypothetical protein [Holosporaceae bacterium]
MKAFREDNIPNEKIDDELNTAGMFALISSENIDTKDILKVYYTRQSIEQIFDIQKNNVDLLPLRAHSEITFRGHLMLTFLASVAFLQVNMALANGKMNAEGLFAVMRALKCKVYNDKILVKETTKKMKTALNSVKITAPDEIALNTKSN